MKVEYNRFNYKAQICHEGTSYEATRVKIKVEKVLVFDLFSTL
jgi:hypothetical protein